MVVVPVVQVPYYSYLRYVRLTVQESRPLPYGTVGLVRTVIPYGTDPNNTNTPAGRCIFFMREQCVLRATDKENVACAHLPQEPSDEALRVLREPTLWACKVCGSTDGVWVCLSCGHVGCGARASHPSLGGGHARHHHFATGNTHAVCIDAITQSCLCHACGARAQHEHVSACNTASQWLILQMSNSPTDPHGWWIYSTRSGTLNDVLSAARPAIAALPASSLPPHLA